MLNIGFGIHSFPDLHHKPSQSNSPTHLHHKHTTLNTSILVPPRKPGMHCCGAFNRRFHPLSPASLIASSGEETPRAPSTNLSDSTYTSPTSYMSKPSGNTASMNISTLGMERRGKSRAVDNTADRFELFLLGDGEKKVTEEADTRESALKSNEKTCWS